MRIFIGSSNEATTMMEEVRDWLEPTHEVIPWNSSRAFPPESNTLERLIDLSETVDGAVFIFSPDDESDVRGRTESHVRDNVLFEYGLFLGALGKAGVCRVVVGKPKPASDLLGIVELRVPESALPSQDPSAIDDVRTRLSDWASTLSPNMRRFGLYLAKYVARIEPINVRDILLNKGERFLEMEGLDEIRALCSEKGNHGSAYYDAQFRWARARDTRRLRRIFVANRNEERGHGFSPGEIEGILKHLDQNSQQVEARWISDGFGFLRDAYPLQLGFALFQKSWFVHWSTIAGTYHDSEQPGLDDGIGDQLHHTWERLWYSSNQFDQDLVATLRAQHTR